MSENPRLHDHLGIELDAFLDGRLSPERVAQVEAHLEACAECANLTDAMRSAGEAVKRLGEEVALPTSLEADIRDLLDAEDRARATERQAPENGKPTTGSRPPSADVGRGRQGLLAAAATLLLAVGATWWFVARSPDSPIEPTAGSAVADAAVPGGDTEGTEVATSSEADRWIEAAQTEHLRLAARLASELEPSAARAALEPELAVASGDALEARWRAGDAGFTTRFIDLAMMGHEVIGGRVQNLGSRRATLAVYTGASGPVTCWMFPGEQAFEANLPTPVDQHVAGNFEFRVYQQGDVAMVVWREGEIICVLVGSGPRDAVVALAHEKAMAPQSV